MKIVYISTSTIPSRAANSIHVMKMCQAFAHNGHEVYLLAPGKKDIELGVENVFNYYGTDKNFQVQNVAWPSLKGRGYIYGWLAARAALKYKPDLVFCRNLIGCYFSAMAGQKVILEMHTPIIDGGNLSEWFFKQLIKCYGFQKLVVITHKLKELYEHIYPELIGKIQVAPDGADPVPYDLEPIALSNIGKRLQVGYVGNLYRGKGMEVISKLAQLCPWADFHVVGGTISDIEFWEGRCRGVANIIFHGFVPHAKTCRYIKSFEVVLLPNQASISTYGSDMSDIGKWTSPLKAFEYMAAGKAIMCSDVPVLREIFTDRKNALLCMPDDVNAWRDALFQLKEDIGLRRALGESSRTEFINNYSWKTRAERILKHDSL